MTLERENEIRAIKAIADRMDNFFAKFDFLAHHSLAVIFVERTDRQFRLVRRYTDELNELLNRDNPAAQGA